MSDINDKFKNGKIYKIVDNTNDNIYIGSTIRTLKYRLTEHKGDYKRHLKGKHNYTTSFDIIKNNNFKIELLEYCPCNNRKELEKRERQYIETNECVNKLIPTRTLKEYYIDNKETINEYAKKYYLNNRDKILGREKQYRINNRDRIQEYQKQYRINNRDKKLEYQNQYRINNRDIIRERKKKQYLNNRDRILELKKIKITCECSSIIRKNDLSRHKRSKKHLNYLKSLN